MWFLGSLFSLWVILAVVTLLGAALVDLCLPWRLRPAAREFLAPMLGLAVLLVPINLLGWFGHGFHSPLCLPLTAAAAAAAAGYRWTQHRRRRGDWRGVWRLAGFAALASFPVLGQLLWFNAFNPFNDTWTYLYQAQWLQHHGFREPALVAGNHTAAVSVLSWQLAGLRITPSFLLGWLQAVFGLGWSYEIYPTTLSLVLVCGALAVGGIVRAAFPGRRSEAWWTALAAAVTLNGFVSGATCGFFPQTVGLAFAAAALALRGMEIAVRPAPGAGPWSPRAVLPLAGCVAAVVYCYPELLPFLAPALAVSYALPWPRSRAEISPRLAAAGVTAVTTALLGGLEIRRAVLALKLQAGAVTGNPVPWSPGEFLAQSLGLKAVVYEGGAWIAGNGWNILRAGLLPVAGFGALLFWAVRARPFAMGTRHRGRSWLGLVPALGMVGLCTAGFIYFRCFVANPWPHGLGPWKPGIGQTYSQMKLSLWASPALLALAAGGLTWCSQRWRVPGVSLLLALWCAAGLGWNASLLLTRANPIRLISGEHDNPFGSYRAFCEPLIELPASDVVYLEAAPGDYGAIKGRELLAYFLGDRELTGNWTVDDNLPMKNVPPAERQSSPEAADWIVQYHQDAPGATAKDALPPLCRLSVARVAHAGWTLARVSEGYDREHDANGFWFYWTARELQMVWRRGVGGPRRMKLVFQQRSLAAAQTVTVRIGGIATGEQTFTVGSTPENSHNESAPFEVADNEVRVSFVGSGEARRASATDARELSYLVGSPTLEPVKD